MFDPRNHQITDFYGFAISVNCVVFGYREKEMLVLLTRDNEQCYALPGDSLPPEESFDQAASRIITSLHHNSQIYIDQAMVSGELRHFERGSLLTIAYFSTVYYQTFASADTVQQFALSWHPMQQLPVLPHSHQVLINESFLRLQRRARMQPLGFYLLQNNFTLAQLQHLFETVLEERYDRPNFRRKILASGLIESVANKEQNVGHRPARMYRFNEEKYHLIKQRGYEYRF
ncbi:hypothetical protein GC194_03195 [bacterium]|nr:hypothetical protein [bacterium]